MAAYFLGVLEISLGNYGSAVVCLDPAYTDDTPLVGTQSLPDLVEAAVRAGRRDLAERALQRLEDRATATGTPLALGLLARSRALLAAPAEARQGYEEALRRCSAGPGPPPSSPAPTSSTASGCAASAGGGKHATSCAPRTTCSTAWASTPSPSGRARSCGPRANMPGSGSRHPGGAHPAGGTDRRAGEPGRSEPGYRRPAVHQPEHRGVPPAQGVPEARGDLPHPARPSRHRPWLQRPLPHPRPECPRLDGRRRPRACGSPPDVEAEDKKPSTFMGTTSIGRHDRRCSSGTTTEMGRSCLRESTKHAHQVGPWPFGSGMHRPMD